MQESFDVPGIVQAPVTEMDGYVQHIAVVLVFLVRMENMVLCNHHRCAGIEAVRPAAVVHNLRRRLLIWEVHCDRLIGSFRRSLFAQAD